MKAQIKIISNPYKKEVKYQHWVEEENVWEDITYDTKRTSNLLKQELVAGFFPFKVKKIVDIIAKDYDNPDGISIFFEGSADEFRELTDVCSDPSYEGKITAKKSELYLANARDILPKVKGLFQEMSPLILQSVSKEKIQRDLTRFSDASSDVVPICVMGNYSAGKSTFINALIGSEILPSGNESVTAKIYEISRSAYADRAFVKCKYLDFDVEVHFDKEDTVYPNTIVENELLIAIKTAISEVENESIVARVNKTLSVINDFEDEESETKISDLIEVQIPFVNGVLSKTTHPFLIFDTPGSNSASNTKHVEVLKEAMANMTNGLPILVATPDSLDSNDNENLYHLMLEMDELDNRFTMIVVNKADSAGIQRRGATEEEQNRILRQAIPRNLYSGGLFYVSSILGLGSKNGGEFLDYIYEDIYDAQVDRYENADNKHYKTLYLFNIQPAQLKRRSDALAAEQKELVFVNSGLFTIETEIEQFAGIYSAYNKCFQSQMFLTRVIKITEDEIEDTKLETEEIRKNINDKLEADKKVLLDKLADTAESHREDDVAYYPTYMSEFLDGNDKTFSVEEIKVQEAAFTEKHEKDLAYEDFSDEAKKARESLTGNFIDNLKKAASEKDGASVRKIFSGLKEDAENAIETYQAQRGTRHQVDKQAADSLLKYVTNMYEKKLAEVYEELDIKSREYWTEKTEQLRNALAQIVSGSEVLTDERRQELERIIITYDKIVFKDDAADTIFEKENFEKKIRVGEMTIWQSDHLNIDKLAKTYNSNIEQGAEKRYQSIEASHRDSAFKWIQALLDEIRENIVEYSPELSKQAKQIRIMTERIEELDNRRIKLNEYTQELYEMMDWKLTEE